MLAPALGRHARHGTLEDLEERLLHALAGNVARDGEVLRLARHLVDLVDVDDAHLGALDVAVGCGDELQEDVLHVLAHIACLGERRGVRDGKGHLKDARERLRQERLARTRGAQKQDVRLGELDIGQIVRRSSMLSERRLGGAPVARVERPLGSPALEHAAVVVIDRYRHGALRVLLAHHVLRELIVNLVRRGHAGDDLTARALRLLINRLNLRRREGIRAEGVLPHHVGIAGILLHEIVGKRFLEDLDACRDALIADKGVVGALHELAHLPLLLPTEGAADGAALRFALVAGHAGAGIHGHYSAPFAASERFAIIRSTRPYSRASAARR